MNVKLALPTLFFSSASLYFVIVYLIHFYVSGNTYRKAIKGELIRNVSITWIMKCLQTIVGVLAAIALIGSIGATSLQQASAGIVVDYKTKFTKLTDDMQKAVLNELAADPPGPDRVQKLLDEYSGNVMALFQNSSKSFEPN